MKNPKFFILFLSIFFFFLQNVNTPHPYWLKIKALFNHAQSYLFPPNLDFRGSISNSNSNDEPVVTEGEVEVEGGGGGGGGGGSKVKEAVAKSLAEGTAAVEESAKSAAEKLKDTLSSSHHQPQDL